MSARGVLTIPFPEPEILKSRGNWQSSTAKKDPSRFPRREKEARNPQSARIVLGRETTEGLESERAGPPLWPYVP